MGESYPGQPKLLQDHKIVAKRNRKMYVNYLTMSTCHILSAEYSAFISYMCVSLRRLAFEAQILLFRYLDSSTFLSD